MKCHTKQKVSRKQGEGLECKLPHHDRTGSTRSWTVGKCWLRYNTVTCRLKKLSHDLVLDLSLIHIYFVKMYVKNICEALS